MTASPGWKPRCAQEIPEISDILTHIESEPATIETSDGPLMECPVSSVKSSQWARVFRR